MGAKMTEKCSFRTSFCQISSDKNSKFRPTGGLDASDREAVAPSSPPLVPPLAANPGANHSKNIVHFRERF